MAQTCYRHPKRETGVSCSSCGRPICPECMTPTPVGMRCPECMRQRTRVTHGAAAFGGSVHAPATFVLIALNVAAYIAEIASGSGGLGTPGAKLLLDYGLFGPLVAEGEWYRLLTSGFLHANVFPHLFFNMLLLFLLGRLLEPALGMPRFVAIYLASLFAGSFGALLLSPNALTYGASGAVFGLFGAAFVIARLRGMSALAGQIGFLIVINLAFTFGARNISVGGHLGGLAAGLLCGLVIVAGERGRLGPNRLAAELIAMVALAVVSIVAALAVA
jgi:membrane associated rhomboid family serine protease